MEVIDIIIPYVDSADPSWQHLFEMHNPKTITEGRNAKNRFRGQGEFFRFFFRGIEQNLPFIRKVHLIVQSKSQIPSWLDISNPKLNIVLHKDFIPNNLLPVFNSTAIEMFIPFIPNLAENFLYANDDTFAYNRMKPEDFFTEDEKVKNKVRKMYKGNTMYQHHINNSYKQIFGETNNDIVNGFGHTIRPYKKSVCLNCYYENEQAILKSVSKFRETYNFNVYLYDNYLIKNGYQIPNEIVYKVINSDSSENNVKVTLDTKTTAIICLEDTKDYINMYRRKDIVDFFLKKFPDKCSFEVNDDFKIDCEERLTENYITGADGYTKSSLDNWLIILR